MGNIRSATIWNFIKNKDYRYLIYTDDLYYELFSINIPEYYPVTINVSAGILAKEEKNLQINNLEDLKSFFSDIICSDKIKMIITKMLEK